MKARWTPFIFAAGLGAGWLMFGGSMRESAEAAGNKSAAPVVRKREARPVTTPHEAKFRSFAKELPKLSQKDQEAFRKSLAPGDRTAAIEALLAQAGPDGISWESKSMLGEILTTWAGEDFDAAWAWCRRTDSDANRKFIASKLLDALVDKDPDRAIALHLEMTAEDPRFSSAVPLRILHKAASKDAVSFLDLLGKIPFHGGSSGTVMEFAADFDFQQAADGFTVLTKNNVGKSPPMFPTNFLSSWAVQDADAAYAWFAKNESSPFETFGSLLEGIEKQGVPGTSYVWAADKLNEFGTARDAMIRSLTQSDRNTRPTTINSIAQAMPDVASRDRFLGDVMTLSFVQDPAVQFGYVLTQMSTPAARLDILQRLETKRLLDAAKIPDSQLQQWGLTRQQVEQLQSPGR